MRKSRLYLPLSITLCAVSSVSAQSKVDYLRDIKPLLKQRCSSCHGPLKQRSGLRVDSVQLMREGGDSGPAIVAGKANKSLLVDVLTGKAGFRMPPEGKPLKKEEVALIAAWINEGARGPASETVVADARKHWSFQSARRPSIPKVKRQAWLRNPIDAFIAAQHERRQLEPRQPAAKELLLRRVYLDLIGIPPTRAELRAFSADGSPLAYEKAVDRLLASPRYGERWGRHWMDVWRYSDWYGRRRLGEIRYSQYHIWRWRDWIIDAVNADKGYDQMIVEMLAGDEVAGGDPKVLRATGFLGRNWYKFNRDAWMRETVEHTAMGFLALTLKCARCHDHKYDPISQLDYYQFRAFFEPHDARTDPVSAAQTKTSGLATVYDARPDAPTYLLLRGDDRYPDKEHPLKPQTPSSLGGQDVSIQSVSLPLETFYPALRRQVVEANLRSKQAAIAAAEMELAKAKKDAKLDKRQAEVNGRVAEKKLAAARAELISYRARVAAERAKFDSAPAKDGKQLAETAAKAERQASLLRAERDLLIAERNLERADGKKASAAKKQLETARKTLAAAKKGMKATAPRYTPLGKIYPKTSTGRRLALARWIAGGKNPRTARVAVNHMWKRHFGAALVPTVANFGLAGKSPTHPKLLDWLAVEFVDSGWSMKHIHRLIVTSNTYRMASSLGDERANLARDADNRYLWRMNARRMEAEVVRDSLLHAAGQLDGRMGGPELAPKLGQTSRRRSVYFLVTPDDRMEFLQLFDLANPNECYERKQSVVPQQALALINSALAQSQSRLLARSLTADLGRDNQGSDASFVDAAFEQILGRLPTETERQRCGRFLSEQTRLLGGAKKLTPIGGAANAAIGPSAMPAVRARENLVHVLFNHNDFVTIR